jgi:hypothetical protein
VDDIESPCASGKVDSDQTATDRRTTWTPEL